MVGAGGGLITSQFSYGRVAFWLDLCMYCICMRQSSQRSGWKSGDAVHAQFQT
jgi:hypothetical protein